MNFMTLLYWERLSSLIKKINHHIVLSNSLKKLGLFSFILLTILASCKKPDESLGENLQPAEDLLNAAVTDSFQISAQTEKVDSLRTDVFANVMTGNYVDPDFGVVKCRAVLQFSPDFTNTGLPNNFEVYSVVLSLGYQQEAYGNNVPMYFEVNELLETLFLDTPYFSNQIPLKSAENLILPGHETHTTRSEYAAILTTDNTEYLNLPLSVELGERLLSADTLLETFEEFSEYFKGLVISSRTVDGRVLNFSNINSKITVNYATESHGTTELGSYTFPFTNSCEAYTVIEQQYFGTALSGLNPNNYIDGSNLCYLQCAGGTRLRLNIGDVRWLNMYDGVTINKAELIVPFFSDSKLAEIDTLTMVYETDPDEFSLTGDYARNSGGNFRKASGYYRFNITNHVQQMLLNEIETDELIIAANPRIPNYYNSIGTRRSLIHGPEYSADDPSQNMRLVITYSH